MVDIFDILSREWPLILGAPLLVISGGIILASGAFAIGWKLKSSIDDGEVRACKERVELAKEREGVAKDKQDELEKEVADLKTKITLSAPQAEVDESFGKVTIALEKAKVANSAVNYVLNAEPGEFKRLKIRPSGEQN